MKDRFKKSDFFNGKYEESFVKFLELVSDDLKVRKFPRICYNVQSPRINPLIITNGDSRIKKPDRIAEEIAAILKDFNKWRKNEPGMIIWLYVVDKTKLQSLVLTLDEDNKSPRLYLDDVEKDKNNDGDYWYWVYPFFYDYID